MADDISKLWQADWSRLMDHKPASFPITDDAIRKTARDTVTYAMASCEPVFLYWSKHNKKFSKSNLRNLKADDLRHVVGTYDETAHPHMVEDDIREWLRARTGVAA